MPEPEEYECTPENKLKTDVEENVYSPLEEDKKVPKKDMFSFSYFQMQKLKKLLLASKDILGYTTEQYLRAAIARGITREEAVFFYQDVLEELHTASRPRHVVEAFLPLLYKVRRWNPIQLNVGVTYSSLEELVRDLEELNDFSVNSTLQRNW